MSRFVRTSSLSLQACASADRGRCRHRSTCGSSSDGRAAPAHPRSAAAAGDRPRPVEQRAPGIHRHPLPVLQRQEGVASHAALCLRLCQLPAGRGGGGATLVRGQLLTASSLPPPSSAGALNFRVLTNCWPGGRPCSSTRAAGSPTTTGLGCNCNSAMRGCQRCRGQPRAHLGGASSASFVREKVAQWIARLLRERTSWWICVRVGGKWVASGWLDAVYPCGCDKAVSSSFTCLHNRQAGGSTA